MARTKKAKYNRFGKDPIPWKGEIAGTSFENHKIYDLIHSIDRLHLRGQYIELRHNRDIPEFEYVNVNNHFQGIQRVNDSKYIILSGASKRSKHAHLFIAQVQSHNSSNQTEIGTNILFKQIPAEDTLSEIICISKDEYWHAGGISICGDILVIPLEGEKKIKNKKTVVSKVIFYNLNNPLLPVEYPNPIRRTNQKAGASTLIKLKGRFLCAVWTDSDKKGKRFDFYISKTQKLEDGFKKAKTVLLDQITLKKGREPRFQTIDFVQQQNGELFLIGYLNTRKTAPIINGTNKCFIYKCLFKLDKDKIKLNLTQVFSKEFDDGGKQYNMGAATGSFIKNDGSLLVYSAYHWKTKKSIKLAEFSEGLDINKKAIRSIKHGVCECYQHKYFTGRCLMVYGDRIQEIDSLKRIKVQGKNFNDKLSSVRFLLPKTHKIQFFEHENFKGKKLEFMGTGKVESIPEFGKLNDKTSSLKIVKIE